MKAQEAQAVDGVTTIDVFIASLPYLRDVFIFGVIAVVLIMYRGIFSPAVAGWISNNLTSAVDALVAHSETTPSQLDDMMAGIIKRATDELIINEMQRRKEADPPADD